MTPDAPDADRGAATDGSATDDSLTDDSGTDGAATAYDAVVFDNDGVLLEVDEGDPDRFRRAVRAAFREVGVADPDDAHVDDLLYGVTVDRLEAICDAYGLDPAPFWAARDAHCSRVQREHIRAGGKGLYPDADALDAIDLPTGIVSTNQHATIEFVLDHFGVEVDAYYGREPEVASLRRKKPNPHYLERALADLGAETALFVGDSESDVLAAARAGVDSVFLRRDHRADYELGVEPTYEVASLRAVPELTGARR